MYAIRSYYVDLGILPRLPATRLALGLLAQVREEASRRLFHRCGPAHRVDLRLERIVDQELDVLEPVDSRLV